MGYVLFSKVSRLPTFAVSGLRLCEDSTVTEQKNIVKKNKYKGEEEQPSPSRNSMSHGPANLTFRFRLFPGKGSDRLVAVVVL